ncbi:hypothetical protein Q8791_20000 [Nocardiopsis sp. CT-R113]|uniref:Lipoprotein n=1 Tax=Nocardiopsis codii TaxID=3065942 RepID=A0ABU7KB96_9ACTN|nr:hypothetical protein [Nocardiopsis sp. CT-R113]MEE2039508.1 hypothetical protein [Nocardiopsis sp. CT-R113]
MRTRKIVQNSFVTAGAGVFLLALTGCSGGPSGTFYGSYVCDAGVRLCNAEDELARLIIDGENVTFDLFECDGPDEDYASMGVLTEDRSIVAWTTDVHYEGTKAITANDGGDVLTMDDTTYLAEGSAPANALVDVYTEDCVDRDSDWSSPLS